MKNCYTRTYLQILLFKILKFSVLYMYYVLTTSLCNRFIEQIFTTSVCFWESFVIRYSFSSYPESVTNRELPKYLLESFPLVETIFLKVQPSALSTSGKRAILYIFYATISRSSFSSIQWWNCIWNFSNYSTSQSF